MLKLLLNFKNWILEHKKSQLKSWLFFIMNFKF